MFNKLFLICVLISICTSNCVKLENICDVFNYNGTQVNSVFRMIFLTRFESISHYLANDSVKYDDLIKNKTQIEMIDMSTKLYNFAINEIYSEDVINNNLTRIIERIEDLADYSKTYDEIASYLNEDNRNKLSQRFESQFNKGISFWQNLYSLSFGSADHLGEENKKFFAKELEKMSIKNGQKYAFEGEEIDEIYSWKQIASLIIFWEGKSEQEDSILVSGVLIPFYNPRYRKTSKCLSSSELPKFYSDYL